MGVLLRWHGKRKNPHLLDKEQKRLEHRFPTLRLFRHGEQAIVYGTYRLAYQGVHIETYEILILIPTEYPDEPPVLYPLGFYPPRGPIPRSDGAHINADGSACVAYVGESRERFTTGSMLVDYIDKFVHPYMIGLTSYLNGDGWPYGERSHGDEGAVEWIAEKLDTTDHTFAVRVLRTIRHADTLENDGPCLCGSGRKLRKCHGSQIAAIAHLLHPR